MKICKNCNKEFPTKIRIGEKNYGLYNRKFCLLCSPFKEHNTKDISKNIITEQNGKMYKICSVCKQNLEFNKENYYMRNRGDYQPQCKSCGNKKTVENQRNVKLKSIEYMGGKCQFCGYSKCVNSLDFHHKDPLQKSFNISAGKCYNFDKLKLELDKCILVCRNCHGEIHGGLLVL